MSREIVTPLHPPAALANAAYAGLLVMLAVLPRSISGQGFGLSDCIAHSVAYGVQGYLLIWGLRPVWGAMRGALLAVIGAASFGLFTEIVQLMLPYRDFQIADLGADAVGAMIGVGVGLALGVGGRNAVRLH